MKTKSRFKLAHSFGPGARPGGPFKAGRPAKPPMFDPVKARARLCRNSYYEFVRHLWDAVVPDKPVWNWHIRQLCDELEAIARRVAAGQDKEYDLIVNIPPGTTKSTICSIMFPAWVWTFMPHARFICCSYDAPLALALSRKCRKVIKSKKYRALFPHVEIDPTQDSKTLFANSAGGERYAVGSGQGVMGNHAHFIVIDDPIDPKRAASDAELAATNIWIKDELSGRKTDKRVTVTVLVMQRLSREDPTAVMAKQAGVRHLKLPATDDFEVSPPELRRFYVDGLLDPVRMPRKVLDAIRSGPRGEFVWAGQYGQDPIPPGGGMFKTQFIVVEPAPARTRFRKLVRYWDKAGTQGGGAYTVGVLMGVEREADGGRFWVLDVVREQLDSHRRERLIRKVARRDGKGVVVGVEQEPGSAGKESASATVRRLPGHVAVALRATGDKEVRADPFSVQVNASNVSMALAPWNDDYIEELRYFPFSTFKDQVDASAGAFELLSRRRARVGAMW